MRVVDLVLGLDVAAWHPAVGRLAVGHVRRGRRAQPGLQHVVGGVEVPLRPVALVAQAVDPGGDPAAVLVAQALLAAEDGVAAVDLQAVPVLGPVPEGGADRLLGGVQVLR
ncbi:hypothetical protein AB0O31_03880 [Kitasatospora cineracea]|uniref:hypothetical protein n=1 Tax=Kitasatospora cineracea TaxID=88074 RepID=UPI00342C3947